MSDWGLIAEAIEDHCRIALDDLPEGELGFEFAQGFGETLPDPSMPHIFTLYPVERRSREQFLQQVVEIDIEFELWTRHESLENLTQRLDDIVTQLGTDTTLGGLVKDSFVSQRAAAGVFQIGASGREWKPEKVGNFVVSVRQEIT